jgi:hypothetical protein
VIAITNFIGAGTGLAHRIRYESLRRLSALGGALKRHATADDSNLMRVILDTSRGWATMCGMCRTLCEVWGSGARRPSPSRPDLVRKKL